ncbi:chromatin complexes subunit BAP18-like, partial [Lingula anatina]
SQIKAQLRKKAYEDAGLPVPAEEKSPKKTTQKQQASGRGEPQAKKQKTAEVTLSALNAPEGDVDIEGIGDPHPRKLDFDSDVDSSML